MDRLYLKSKLKKNTLNKFLNLEKEFNKYIYGLTK